MRNHYEQGGWTLAVHVNNFFEGIKRREMGRIGHMGPMALMGHYANILQAFA
jgi:hypothetical protein